MPNFVKIGLRAWAGRTSSLSHVLVLVFCFFVCVFCAPRPGYTAGPILTGIIIQPDINV